MSTPSKLQQHPAFGVYRHSSFALVHHHWIGTFPSRRILGHTDWLSSSRIRNHTSLPLRRAAYPDTSSPSWTLPPRILLPGLERLVRTCTPPKLIFFYILADAACTVQLKGIFSPACVRKRHSTGDKQTDRSTA